MLNLNATNQIDALKERLETAAAVLIGAGSGLSELAEQAVSVGQMGVTHQSVAAMAAVEDDLGDEDGI